MMESFGEEAMVFVVHEHYAHGMSGGGSRHRWLSMSNHLSPREARFR